MDGHIGRLHCRYQVISTKNVASVLTARLDSLVQARMAETVAEALDQVLGDDQTVYVLRRVQSRMALNVDSSATDGQLARRWGEHLAGAVMRGIAGDSNDSTNLIRFIDQADYVAHFVADLLQGRAWDCWFYGSFAGLRSRSTRDALHHVLLDNRDHLPSILSYLHRYGTLDRLLADLDVGTLRLLWSDGLGAYIHPDPETIRPLFAHALRLMDRLNLWTRRSASHEALFQSYLANRPAPAYWGDRRGLTVAFLDIVRFLAHQGYLRRDIVAPDTASFTRLHQAIKALDWLDTAWLQASVLELLSGGPGDHSAELPVRPAGRSTTPRQRELLADVLALLRENSVILSRSHPESLANALRLYAALITRVPRWGGEAIVTSTIQRLLAAWVWLVQTRSPMEMLQQLRQGDVEGALHTVPEDSRARAAGTLQCLIDPEEIGLSILTILVGGEAQQGHAANALLAMPAGHRALRPLQSSPGLVAPRLDLMEAFAGGERQWPGGNNAGVETGCAGVALLLRACVDIRLPSLVEGVGYPSQGLLTPLRALIVALGLRWAGTPGIVNGRLDAGLSVLAGLESAPRFEALHKLWANTGPEAHTRFQAAMLRILAGQRLMSESILHLYGVPMGDDHTALVAGHATAGLWPLGQVIGTQVNVVQIVTAWLNLWEEATGHRPDLVVCDGSLADVTDLRPDSAALAVVLVPEESLADLGAAPGELVTTHRTGREALLAALAGLEYGRLGVPDADLTVALTAIAVLRVWARWLRQFAASTTPYLLENFIRRPGQVSVGAQEITVDLEPRPLDIVIDVAGYSARLERVPWLDHRHVLLQLRGS